MHTQIDKRLSQLHLSDQCYVDVTTESKLAASTVSASEPNLVTPCLVAATGDATVESSSSGSPLVHSFVLTLQNGQASLLVQLMQLVPKTCMPATMSSSSSLRILRNACGGGDLHQAGTSRSPRAID